MNSLKIILWFRSNTVIYYFRSVSLSLFFVAILLGLSYTIGSADELPDDFSITPPVSFDDWPSSAQDYAEFNSGSKNKFHTGLDISASGRLQS